MATDRLLWIAGWIAGVLIAGGVVTVIRLWRTHRPPPPPHPLEAPLRELAAAIRERKR